MIIVYDLKDKELVSVTAQSINDEKYLLKKAIHISIDRETKKMAGIVKLEDLKINFKKLKERIKQ